MNYSSDIDECTFNRHNCHSNADCENEEGSYTCKCVTGYTGNGISCLGKTLMIIYMNIAPGSN